jgi:hypothetical protein
MVLIITTVVVVVLLVIVAVPGPYMIKIFLEQHFVNLLTWMWEGSNRLFRRLVLFVPLAMYAGCPPEKQVYVVVIVTVALDLFIKPVVVVQTRFNVKQLQDLILSGLKVGVHLVQQQCRRG